ncbi:MAG: hydantoinase/oxoprolinase family protein [Dongiaceae bacterium]
MTAARIGVDIGGTFTDIVLAREDGRLLVAKVSSTTQEPERAVVDGVAGILRQAELPPAAVTEVLHGTTVGSNTILQKRGAATGLITTEGFRDVLEIGRVRTPDLFDLDWDKPEPLVRRRHRLEVAERIAADGSVVRPLDEAGLDEAVDRLAAEGIEAVAICFINSYRNPAHERQALARIARRRQDLAVTASVDILPEIKEYERTSTTVVNAYLLPVMRRYLERLADGLAGLGISAPLLVVSSNGGAARADLAAEKPCFFIGSGPAAGVVGAARLGVAAGTPDLIAFDMGGTTAKASLVEGGQVARVHEYEFRAGISTPSRFIKAGGYMIKAPAIDIAEVGAGAGSIAWVDAAGLLKVGPQSAGGDPGPACYGRGGDKATVTDANLLLGYLNPGYLAGGSLPLEIGRARAAIADQIARPLGLSPEEAAYGIRQVANASMARALRAVTVERGVDPRDFRLVAFGGSGPVHACELADMLSIRQVVIPDLPGVFTAVGMLASEVERHFVRAFPAPLDALAAPAARETLEALRAEALAALAAEGYGASEVALDFAADLRFAGQDSELARPLDPADLSPAALAAIADGFLADYARIYQYRADEPLEIVNLRVVGRARPRQALAFAAPLTAARHAAGGTRPVQFGRGGETVATPVVERAAALAAGRTAGPLIVESYDSTVVVPPGWTLAADPLGNLLLDRA